MLVENNYGVWAVKMKILMRAQGVWAAVESKGPIDVKMDQMALAAIVRAVPEAVVMAISEEEMAKKAWKALEEMHVGEQRVKKAQVQTLKRELDGMYMGDSEKINDFALKITTIVNEIRTLGTKVEEITVVEYPSVTLFPQILGGVQQNRRLSPSVLLPNPKQSLIPPPP
jgi:hypothetical protein